MKPLNMIDDIVSRHKVKRVEQERVDILAESKRLEQEYLNDDVTHSEYEQKKAHIHDKLIMLDMEKLFYEVDDKLNDFLEKQKIALKLNNKRETKLESLLEKKNLIEDDILLAREMFHKNKFDSESFKKLLKEKQTEIMEIENEIVTIYKNQAEDKAKEMEIMLNTQIELKKHMAEEMAGDISLQVPDSGDSQLPIFNKNSAANYKKASKHEPTSKHEHDRKEKIEVPKHHNIEINEPRRLRRKHRHMV